MNRKILKNLLILLGPLFLLFLWCIIPCLGLINEVFLPKPILILREIFNAFINGGALKDFLYTFFRTIAGFIFASIWSIPAGLVIGYYTGVYRTFEFLIDFFRSLPATALIPLALIVFGANTEIARIFVVFFAGGLVLLMNTAYGVKNRNRTRMDIAVTCGASSKQKFITVILRDALTDIFAGLRVCLSLSLVLVIVSEMFIGTKFGLGHRIYDAQLMNHIAEMYGFIFITGLMGYFINKSYMLIENRIIHWKSI